MSETKDEVISREELLSLAKLSRLNIDVGSEKTTRLLKDLAAIVETIDHLQQCDVQGVAPTRHPVALPASRRDDAKGTVLDKALVLELAPEHDGDGVLVPRVVG